MDYSILLPRSWYIPYHTQTDVQLVRNSEANRHRGTSHELEAKDCMTRPVFSPHHDTAAIDLICQSFRSILHTTTTR